MYAQALPASSAVKTILSAVSSVPDFGAVSTSLIVESPDSPFAIARCCKAVETDRASETAIEYPPPLRSRQNLTNYRKLDLMEIIRVRRE